MVKVMMYGCNGYMGHVICNLIKDMENVTVAAGIDPCPGDQKDFPVFTSLDACDVDVDVIIDFSAAVAVDGVLDYAAAKKIPLVECTTGLSEEQLAHLEEASKQTAVLRSANMSLGVNTLLEMVKTAAKILGYSDIRILFCELLPNIIPQAIVLLMTDMVGLLVIIVTLGYLGIGISPPTPDWGTMISEGQTFMTSAWWLSVLPGMFVVYTGVALSFIGDGLADRFR